MLYWYCLHVALCISSTYSHSEVAFMYSSMRFDEKLPFILKLKAISKYTNCRWIEIHLWFHRHFDSLYFQRTSLDMDGTLDFDPFSLMGDLTTLIILGSKSVRNLSKNGYVWAIQWPTSSILKCSWSKGSSWPPP